MPRCTAPLLILSMITPLVMTTTGAYAQGPQLVELAPIIRREVREIQAFVGTVMPSRRAAVGSAVDGRVVEFPINEGDRVSEGQTLAQLLTETISLELTAAEAELDLRQQELVELENGSRPEEIEQARARMESAKATAEYAESQEKRVASLFQRGGAATDQQLEEATSLARAARESYADAAAAHALAVAGPRPERLAQARARIAMQRAVVDKLRDQLTKHTIVSRFDGYVAAEHSEVGQWVSQGDLVAEIVALDEVDIEAKVIENQVPFVRIGSSVTVTLPALPGVPFPGTVLSVVPQADVRARTFPVKIRVKNVIDEQSQPTLKSGMLAQVLLPTGPKTDALLVPKDALVLDGAQARIWVVDPSTAGSRLDSPLLTARARAVPVLKGIEDGDLIQVRGDVSETSSVVVMGNERIPPSRPDQPTLVQWVPAQSPAGGSHGAD